MFGYDFPRGLSIFIRNMPWIAEFQLLEVENRPSGWLNWCNIVSWKLNRRMFSGICIFWAGFSPG